MTAFVEICSDMAACQMQLGLAGTQPVDLSPYFVLSFLGGPPYPLPTWSLSVWAALPSYFRLDGAIDVEARRSGTKKPG